MARRSRITVTALKRAHELVPGAPPLIVPAARRCADRLNDALAWFDAEEAAPARRGRPADLRRLLLFHRLADTFEELTERPFAVAVDQATNEARGAALEWTLAVLGGTALAAWATARREAVATWIKRARHHAIDLDVALVLAERGPAEAAAARPRPGRKKKSAGLF